MAEIQFIVDKLNEPPFDKDLRLVSTVLLQTKKVCVSFERCFVNEPCYWMRCRRAMRKFEKKVFGQAPKKTTPSGPYKT